MCREAKAATVKNREAILNRRHGSLRMNVQGGESRDREESRSDSEPVGMAKCCDRRKLVVIASFPMNEARMPAFMGKKRPNHRAKSP